MKKKTFLIILIIFLNINTYCQDWVRIYGDNISAYPHDLIETYDKGYIISGEIYWGQIVKYGWLIKTDINGEILWDKKFGNIEYKTAIRGISQTNDGGYIITGGVDIYDSQGDPFILKLNTCGKKEWCKIFHMGNHIDYGEKVIALPGGGYLGLIRYYGYDYYNKRIWLFRLDEQGNIIWKKVYAQQDPKITNEDCYDLTFFQDSSFLITGECYYPNPGDTNNYYWERPFFIKVDTTGEEIWTLPWGKTEYYYGSSVNSVIDKNDNIYSVGRHSRSEEPWGDSPVLLKTNSQGQQLYYKDILEDTYGAIAFTVTMLNDTSLAVGTSWINNHNPDSTGYTTIFKVDTLGNIIKQKDVLVSENSPRCSLLTFDKKLLIAGGFYFGNNWDIYMWKFNQDLEYDSIYTQAYTYDSLCPYGIASDTISLDTTTVNLDELWIEMQGGIKIIPNPAKDKLRIEIKNSKV
ncbi:MAG: hypothetical protein J7J86_01950, partial [Bacteroidales bacterium]|nr:hypothetical protein [Bacteroidales bacterium]